MPFQGALLLYPTLDIGEYKSVPLKAVLSIVVKFSDVPLSPLITKLNWYTEGRNQLLVPEDGLALVMPEAAVMVLFNA